MDLTDILQIKRIQILTCFNSISAFGSELAGTAGVGLAGGAVYTWTGAKGVVLPAIFVDGTIITG